MITHSTIIGICIIGMLICTICLSFLSKAIKKTTQKIKKLDHIIRICKEIQIYNHNVGILQEYLCDVALMILHRDKSINDNNITMEQLKILKLKNQIGEIFSKIINENSDKIQKTLNKLNNFVENLEQNYEQIENKKWYDIIELPVLHTYNFEKGKESYPNVILLGIKDNDEYSNKRVTITSPPFEYNYSNINSLFLNSQINNEISDTLQSMENTLDDIIK